MSPPPAAAVTSAAETATHLVRLGGSPWWLWRVAAVRSTGFPVDWARALTDGALAAAVDRESADRPPSADYRRAYLDGWARNSATLAAVARDGRFREAVCWQSPHVLTTCTDKVAAAPGYLGRLPPAGHRQHLLTTASYLQRYAVKNDSIGFFGPVGWAWWTTDPAALTVRTGPRLLARRTVYFEGWAIDAVARALSADPALAPWLRPRVAPQHLLAGDRLRTPTGQVLPLSELDALLLRLSDGTRSVAELAVVVVEGLAGPRSVSRSDVERAVAGLLDRGLVAVELAVPAATFPERLLDEQLRAIPDRAAAAPALDRLAELTTARSAVAAAAGDADRLREAMSELDAVFGRITGAPAARRHGQTYAGRTLVYEDTVRYLSVDLGRPLRDWLAGPLDLVLRSARWLANAAADRYRQRLAETFDRLCARTGQDWVPLARLYAAATPDLAFSHRECPPPVAELLTDFQARWARVLQMPPGVGRWQVDAAAADAAVEREFPASPPAWSAAVHHSPDVLLAAASPAAVGRGEFLAVLGELHVAVNTLQSRVFVQQADDPGWFARAEEHDHGDRRVFPVPAKESALVNSRTYPPALLPDRYTYWALHPDPAVRPAGLLPAAALRVVRGPDGLLVRSTVDGREFDLVEFLGEVITGAVLNGFRPLAPAGHLPRVTIDRLVLARESWRFDAAELGWAAESHGERRYRQAWLWRREQRLPRRCFYRVPVEDKPMFVDFSSVVLVELLARAIRRTTRSAEGGSVSFTELLPDLTETWLTDAQGRRYTAELRMIAVDPLGLAR